MTVIDYTAGILGLEAKHDWNMGSFVLNDISAWPAAIAKLKPPIDGIHDLPTAENNREIRTARRGSVIYPSYERDRNITYRGTIYAPSNAAYRIYVQQMRSAFRERNLESLMRSIPDAAYGTDVWAYYARVIDLKVPQDPSRVSPQDSMSVYQGDFQLDLQLSDPRYFLYSDLISDAGHADAASNDYTVIGYTDSDPVIKITGFTAVADITIENLSVQTSNGHAILKLLGAQPSGDVTIDFGSRTAQVDAGGGDIRDLTWLLDITNTNWWDELIPGIVPGVNTLKVTAGSGTWGMSYYPRSI